MIGWLDTLPADLRTLVTAAAGDAPVTRWSTEKRRELGGLSVQQALDDPRTAPTAIAWLTAKAGGPAAAVG